MEIPDFDGRYREAVAVGERELGQTFRALARTGRPVFVKLLRQDKLADPVALELFSSEPAWLKELARIGNCAPALLDEGRWRGRPYFALPWLEGWSLDRAMGSKPCFAGASVLRLIDGCLEALEPLHAAGLVHCDVSPDNLFLETGEPPDDGRLPASFRVRLVDFNSVQRAGPVPGGARRVFVKNSYVAPELAKGQPLSGRADVYSLGVTFYELLTGDRPYVATSLADAARLTDANIPQPPSVYEIPTLVQRVLRWMLAVDEKRRAPSAADCRRAIRELLDASSWLAAEPQPAAPEPREGASSSPPAPRRRTVITTAHGTVPGDQVHLAAEAPGWGVLPERESTNAGLVSPPPPSPARKEEISTVAVVLPADVARQGARNVGFSVFAPGEVAPGASFVLEAWAYPAEDRAEALERAGRAGRMIERGSRDLIKLAPQAELTLMLRLDGFEIEDPVESFAWCGETTNAAFIVKAPKDLAPGIYPGQLKVLHCGVLLTKTVFDLAVGQGRSDKSLPAREVRVRSAFASYASEDRPEVLRRVQGLSAAGVDVFLDVLSLRAGQDWEGQLVRNIRERDVLYLFWSPAAKRSEWVEKEWRLALKEKGLDAIHPIPLADPREALPPPELASRHFNDLMLACLRSQELALAAGS